MYFENWLKVQQTRSINYTLMDHVYKTETLSMSIPLRASMIDVWWLYEFMVSSDHEPEESWALLQGGYKEKFLEVFNFCRDNGLKNLQRFWGRRFNMLYNIPKSFETYSGRIYEITL